MPSELIAEELAGEIRAAKDIVHGDTFPFNGGEIETLAAVIAAAEAHLAMLRAPKDEHGADWDVCWHCRDCLIVEVPRCEKCPAPGDCDDEDCEADGCVEERDALACATGGDRG